MRNHWIDAEVKQRSAHCSGPKSTLIIICKVAPGWAERPSADSFLRLSSAVLGLAADGAASSAQLHRADTGLSSPRLLLAQVLIFRCSKPRSRPMAASFSCWWLATVFTPISATSSHQRNETSGSKVQQPASPAQPSPAPHPAPLSLSHTPARPIITIITRSISPCIIMLCFSRYVSPATTLAWSWYVSVSVVTTISDSASYNNSDHLSIFRSEIFWFWWSYTWSTELRFEVENWKVSLTFWYFSFPNPLKYVIFKQISKRYIANCQTGLVEAKP